MAKIEPLRSQRSRRSLLVNFRNLWLSFNRELGPAVRSEIRAWHSPLERLQGRVRFHRFRKIEGGGSGARFSVNKDLSFLDLKASESHPLSRQKPRHLVEQLDRVEVRIDRPLKPPPAISRFLDSANRRLLRSYFALQLADAKTLPLHVSDQRKDPGRIQG